MRKIPPTRAGVYLKQGQGYRAFIPASLPPDPPVKMSSKMQMFLSAADRAIGRLDAATELLPNPELFVAMYVRKEAVYSSQIEGTQASLVDLLEYETEMARQDKVHDIKEVVNYINALNYGLERLKDLPLSIRLIKEIHAKLLEGVRGAEREPGEFRRSQNWIGPHGCNLNDAVFVPPPPHEILFAMGELENFCHEETQMPPLIKFGLVHAQFETIHPFLDGNGRMGRLFITFLLCWRGILKRPLLYLSAYLRRNREEYYDRLQKIRDFGDWEGWLEFFLTGVEKVSHEASETARQIQKLRDEHRTIIGNEIQGTPTGLILLEHLFERPMLKVTRAANIIQRSYPVANELISRFVELGLLEEITGLSRNRIYAYQPYIDILQQ